MCEATKGWTVARCNTRSMISKHARPFVASDPSPFSLLLRPKRMKAQNRYLSPQDKNKNEKLSGSRLRTTIRYAEYVFLLFFSPSASYRSRLDVTLFVLFLSLTRFHCAISMHSTVFPFHHTVVVPQRYFANSSLRVCLSR